MQIANIIEDPVAHALIRILITYEKYNFESEEAGLFKAVKIDEESQFDEIELMKELVIEFTAAIDERMKEEDPPENGGPNSPTLPNNQEVSVGKKLRTMVKEDKYLTINEFITKHPEFQQIKDEAKQRVLMRVRKYKDSSEYKSSQINDSVFHMSPMQSPLLRSPVRTKSFRVDDDDSPSNRIEEGH